MPGLGNRRTRGIDRSIASNTSACPPGRDPALERDLALDRVLQRLVTEPGRIEPGQPVQHGGEVVQDLTQHTKVRHRVRPGWRGAGGSSTIMLTTFTLFTGTDNSEPLFDVRRNVVENFFP